ncbi:MAG TPA: hypothetical protein VJG32_22280 [Anaerolineae bacterium]|nr:hypothetical protein [Anaerolineae bacterium]
MPSLTRLFIKTALAYFVAALLTGVVVAARPALGLPLALAALTPVYFHLRMVGWITQLIFGVGHWMFPKFSREQPRGSDRFHRTCLAAHQTAERVDRLTPTSPQLSTN